MRAWRAGADGTDGTERGKRRRGRGGMADARTGTDEGERERTGSGRTTPGSRPQGGPERTGGNRTGSCPGYIVIGTADGKMGRRDRMGHGGRAAWRAMRGTEEPGAMGVDAGGSGELGPWRGRPARIRLAVAIGRGVFRNGEADGRPGNPSAHRRNVRGTPRRPPPWPPVRIRCARGCGCFPAARIPGPGRAPQAAGRAVRKR